MRGFLHHDDRNSMTLGVESRSPFLDHRLAELALGLRPQDLIRDGRSKAVLIDAMRGIVPDAVLDRPYKQGFSVDQADWLTGAVGDVIEETFSRRDVLSGAYVDADSVLGLLDAQRSGRSSRPEELWRAFMVERWLSLFVAPERLQAPPPPRPAAERPPAAAVASTG
jgi:asparagine synthase (glutamine-hydrolysing)